MDLSEKKSLYRTGALLLGLAMKRVFPRAQLLQLGRDRLGFFCAFSYEGEFEETFLPLLENAMKEILREELEERVMEMVPRSAKELFLHHGQKGQAEAVAKKEGTVFVGQMGDFFALCDGPLVDKRLCKTFSLLSFEKTKHKVRISGIAFEKDKELKTFLKKYRQYPKKNHEILAEELELYKIEDGQWFWHPKGQKLREILISYWEKMAFEEGFSRVLIPQRQEKKYFSQSGKKKFCHLFEEKDTLFDFAPLEKRENRCISYLQFIQKFIKIFGFEATWILSCSKQKKPNALLKKALAACEIAFEIDEEIVENPRVGVFFADAIGRLWQGPSIEFRKDAIALTLFGELQRFIALLIEKSGGELPFWLCPEQVRLIPFEGVDFQSIKKILDDLAIRVFLDLEETPLGEKIHRALRAKVPYVMVFGKREEKADEISVRAYGQVQETRMKQEQMKHVLERRKEQI